MAAEKPEAVFTHDLADGGAHFRAEAMDGTTQARRLGIAVNAGVQAAGGILKQVAALRTKIQAMAMPPPAMPADHQLNHHPMMCAP